MGCKRHFKLLASLDLQKLKPKCFTFTGFEVRKRKKYPGYLGPADSWELYDIGSTSTKYVFINCFH